MIGITRADGSTIRVEFKHHIGACKIGGKRRNGFTTCGLLLAEKDQDPRTAAFIAVGRAVCSSKDHYVKEKGREESILLAVQDGVTNQAITMDERAAILQSYFHRPRGTNPAIPTPKKQPATVIIN